MSEPATYAVCVWMAILLGLGYLTRPEVVHARRPDGLYLWAVVVKKSGGEVNRKLPGANGS